jgi:hypothetical protein
MQALNSSCSLDEQVKIFKCLDKDKDLHLNYNEFCGLKGDAKAFKVRGGSLKVVQPVDVSVAAMNDSAFRHPLYYMPKKRRLQSLTQPLHLSTSIMGPVVPQSRKKGSKLNKSMEFIQTRLERRRMS